MIRAFLGWHSTLITMLVGAVAGCVGRVAPIILGMMRREDYLPFGPLLAFSVVVSLLFHQQLIAWYTGIWAGQPLALYPIWPNCISLV